jgi:hypothetical protein
VVTGYGMGFVLIDACHDSLTVDSGVSGVTMYSTYENDYDLYSGSQYPDFPLEQSQILEVLTVSCAKSPSDAPLFHVLCSSLSSAESAER